MDRLMMLVSVIILALWNLSFRWPVSDGVITSTFGESRSDHFHDGIDMISSTDNVYPVKGGKLLYVWNKALFPLENYWGGGNFKVISHDDGTCSVYMHLQDVDSLKDVYSENEIVGYIGDTGHSYGKHLHFSVLNHAKRESLNPYSLLPAFGDAKAPVISNFFVKIDNRYIMIRDNSDIRLTKHYPLLVEIRDVIRGNENLGIYRIKAVFNGSEVLNNDFSIIRYSAKGLTVGNRVFDDVFDEKGYYRIGGITFNEGINTLTVSVSDFNGNLSEKTFTINVNLDIK